MPHSFMKVCGKFKAGRNNVINVAGMFLNTLGTGNVTDRFTEYSIKPFHHKLVIKFMMLVNLQHVCLKHLSWKLPYFSYLLTQNSLWRWMYWNCMHLYSSNFHPGMLLISRFTKTLSFRCDQFHLPDILTSCFSLCLCHCCSHIYSITEPKYSEIQILWTKHNFFNAPYISDLVLPEEKCQVKCHQQICMPQ